MMKILLATICFFQLSCSNNEEALKRTITKLEAELDACKNGAPKLLGRIKTNYVEKKYSDVKSIYLDLKEKFPETPEFAEAKVIYDAIIKIETEAKEMAEAEKAQALAAQKVALKRLKKDYDDVSNITWYKNPYFTHYNNSFKTSIYMGQSDVNGAWLRLKMSYTGSDWLFFTNAYLSYEGNTKEFKFNKYDDKTTDHDSGEIWEWIDIYLDKSDITFLRKFCKSKKAKMRLSGKYTKTRTLSYKERKGIEDVLKGYDALNSNK